MSTAEGGLALQLVAALPGAVFAVDAAGRLALANPAARKLLDLAPEAPLANLPLPQLFHRLAERGFCGPGDPAALADQALRQDRRQPWRAQHSVAQPSAAACGFEIASLPLPGGAWACTITALPDPPQPTPAEAALRARLQLTERALLENPSGIAVYGADRRLALHNAAYETLHDLPAGTLQAGQPFEAVLDRIIAAMPGDPGAKALFDSRRAVDRSQRSQYLRQRADGTTVRATSQPLSAGGFLVVLEDVSPLRAAEAEATRRAALLDGVLAALPHGVCVYGPDRRLRLVNAAFRTIMGTARITLGEPLLDILRRRETEGLYVDRGDPERIYAAQFDFSRPAATRRRLDGRVVSSRTAPLPDGGHIAVMSDVTALHRAEAEAQRRADLLQAMMDSMRHGVCLFDKDRRLVAANILAAPLTGLRPEELVPGAALDDLARLQLARGQLGTESEGQALFDRRIQGAVPLLETFLRRTREGRLIEVSTDPTPDGGFVRIYTDVTAEQQALAEIQRARVVAEEASFAKTRFLATMSHELRTPLHAVIGFAEALLDPGAAPRRAEFATTILEAGRQLLGLIDAVLAVAQLGTGGLQVETRPLYLPSILEGVLRQQRGAAEAAGVTLALEPLPPLPRAAADERRLRQILLNLLDNAVKFTPAGGQVRLAATVPAPGLLEITVQDSGIGMAPGQLEQAFAAFVQLETSHARRYAGSGLGLYLARALAEAMQASLTLDSARGAGTTARLRLVAVPPAAAPPTD